MPYIAALMPSTHIYNGGVSGETSTQIRARMVVATSQHTFPTLIWAGRNGVLTSPETVKSDIAAMVAALKTDNYLVLSILNGDRTLEKAGEANYNTIIGVNQYLATTYGSKYWDVRAHLIANNDGSAQDLIDVANDVVPTSLRVDDIHLKQAGYLLVGAGVKSRLGL